MNLSKKLILGNDKFENIRNSLIKRTEEAFNYLQIPEYEKRQDTNEPIYPLNRLHLFQNVGIFDDFFLDKPEQYIHSLRVGLYSIPIMNFLGIKGQEWKKKFFVASLCHDGSKGFFADIVDKNEGFNSEDMKRMQLHVSYDLIESFWDEDIKAIIERHHYYRLINRYPENPKSKETPERKFLASVLGIIDTYDAAATRRNERSKGVDSNNVKKILMQNFGTLDLSYNGNSLSLVKLNGEEFINQMYGKEIFGRDNPLNPFKTFGSLFP